MKSALAILGLILAALAVPARAPAEEVTAEYYRYRGYEMSSGYYEEYEVKPQYNRPFVLERHERRGVLAYGPAAALVGSASRQADSHGSLRFYAGIACAVCHVQQASNNLHVVRVGLACRQCHGGEPIPGNEHYYAPLNRLRRHAYVCSKCHQGAGYSFAAYLVHEPDPSLAATAQSFPVLSWAFWIMVGIAVLTFALFLPHTLLWGLREFFPSRGKEDEP